MRSIPRFAALAALLAGCGQSYCERYANELEGCEGDYEATEEDIEACETQMEPCSASDEAALNRYNDCLQDEGAGFCPEDFDTTITGTDLPAWMDAIVTCAAELDDLSQACMGVMGMTTPQG